MLFIDEIHMIVGAGASDGNSFDAGNFSVEKDVNYFYFRLFLEQSIYLF